MARYRKAYRPLTGMSLIEFQAKYGTEEACEQALFRHKWPKGYVCPKCDNKTYYKTRCRRHSLLECQACGHQESPTNGTAFENSKLPLVKVFLACFFLAETKSSGSAVLLAQYISISVKTGRNLLRKLRTIMIEADSHYKLSGKIVIDEGFFGAPKSGKRGRGTAKIKAMLQGTFHGLGAKRVQGYFSEFAYRFNRRDSKTPIVEHLLRSCAREGYTNVPALAI